MVSRLFGPIVVSFVVGFAIGSNISLLTKDKCSHAEHKFHLQRGDEGLQRVDRTTAAQANLSLMENKQTKPGAGKPIPVVAATEKMTKSELCAPCKICPACPLVKGVDTLNYENPLPDMTQISHYKHLFAKLPNNTLNFQQDSMIELYERLKPYAMEYKPHHERNGMYYKREATTLYTMLRHFRPNCVIEIGSGHSSNVASLALDKNALQRGAQSRAKHIIIEPFRSSVVNEQTWSSAEVLVKKVQDVPMSIYEALGENDLLCIDSSHVMQPYGDTILELLFILPRLKKGVWVHIHDIYLPYDYRGGVSSSGPWVGKEHYTEQWMLAAFLYENRKWEIIWSAIFLENDVSPDFFRDGFGGGRQDSSGMYIRRIDD